MSRLVTCGWETQVVDQTTAARDPEGQALYKSSGGASINTVTPRSGAACVAITANGGGQISYDFTGVSARDYYLRVAVRFPALSFSAACAFIAFGVSGGTPGIPVHGVLINTDDTLQMFDNGGGAVGTKSSAVSANTWYVVEYSFHNNASGVGVQSFRVDGTTIQSNRSSSLMSNLPATANVGKMLGADTTKTIRLDDLAFNDDQGTVDNTWVGVSRKVVFLKPTSDSARGNWTGGAGGTTNLFDAVNNTPPAGVAVASATNTSQIKNTTGSVNSAVFNSALYTDSVASGGGGLASTDQVTRAYVVSRIGNSTTTSRSMLASATNPTLAATISSGTSAAADDTANTHTGWSTQTPVTVYDTTSGSVALATTPTVTVTKNNTSTDGATCDVLGIMVEYLTPVTGAAAISGTGTISATGVRTVNGAASISGGGTISATGSHTGVGAASIAGTGTISATGVRTRSGAASIAGTGTITATGTRIVSGAAQISGSGSMSATGTRTRLGTASIAGTGTVSASGTRTTFASASVAGTGSMSATGTRKTFAVVALSGAGTISASGTVTLGGAAQISGSGTISATGVRKRFGAATVAGSGLLSATGTRRTFGVASVAGAGSMSATGHLVLYGAAEIEGAGTIEASGKRYRRWNPSPENNWPFTEEAERWNQTPETERWEASDPV